MQNVQSSGSQETGLKTTGLAYCTDSRTSKLPKGILGWASGAERIERVERNLQKGTLRSEGNMTATLPATLPAPLPLHSAHMLWAQLIASGLSTEVVETRDRPIYRFTDIFPIFKHFTIIGYRFWKKNDIYIYIYFLSHTQLYRV